uniref:Si:dkey-246g23.4 n=1 Tax=Salarias fasciatus TaxID=181472 RepID=A0A672GST1_SALFA
MSRFTKDFAPDGGYAWFILLSAFIVFGLTFGVIKAFGAFYVEIHQYFETTAAGTSWITSIAVAAIHIVAPIASALSTRYGCRSVVIIGGLICSVGVAVGSFSRTMVELYLTVGFLNGFGYALTWTPTMTLLGLYFEKRRPVANALASSGECILTFILTPLFQLLIDSYSWRGALLILGGLQLNLCVCGMLLRPLEATRDASCVSEVKEGDHAELKAKIRRYVDYTLITNARFMVYSMFGVFAALGFFAPGLFLIPYARSRGIEEYQAAALMSISAVLDLFGRVFFGWLANLRLVETVLLAEVGGSPSPGSALGFFMPHRSSGGLFGPPIAGEFYLNVAHVHTQTIGNVKTPILTSCLWTVRKQKICKVARQLHMERSPKTVLQLEIFHCAVGMLYTRPILIKILSTLS